MIDPLVTAKLCRVAENDVQHAALQQEQRKDELTEQVSEAKAAIIGAAVHMGNVLQREREAQAAADAAANTVLLAERAAAEQQRARSHDERHPVNESGRAYGASRAAPECGPLGWVHVQHIPSHPEYRACHRWIRGASAGMF